MGRKALKTATFRASLIKEKTWGFVKIKAEEFT
jgi:hypothetical protein